MERPFHLELNRRIASQALASSVLMTALLLSSGGCRTYRLMAEQFRLQGTVTDAGKALEGARVAVVDTSFIDPRRYKHLNEEVGASGADGRIDLDYRCKRCKVVGPIRMLGESLGCRERPGKLGLEVTKEGYAPRRFYTRVDTLPRNAEGKRIVDMGELSLEAAKKHRNE